MKPLKAPSVTVSTIQRIVEAYPDWRLTSHTTDAGNEVMMIEFADEGNEYTSGLPGKFVEMVSKAEGDVQ